jgi:hypothetical protein
MAQARHDEHVGLAHALLNGPCPGPARQTRHIWPSIPPHDNDGPRLSSRHLVRHSAFFSLSPHVSASTPPILGRGRGSKRPLPIFVRHQPRHQPAQCLLHVHEGVSQHARLSFSSSSDVPFVFPPFIQFFLPNLLPLPTARAASRPNVVDAGTDELVLLLAFLRA